MAIKARGDSRFCAVMLCLDVMSEIRRQVLQPVV